MSWVARRIPSVPVRTPIATWETIANLIAGDGTPARGDLDAARSVAAMLIAEEHTKNDPIIVSGAGPQVRIYTLHGEDAVDAEEALPLPHDPTDGDWIVSLPASGDDLAVAQKLLTGTRVVVRDTAALVEAFTSALPVVAPGGKAGRHPVIDVSRLEEMR